MHVGCGSLAWPQNFYRIFKENNEIDKPDSYMPYFMELKLSTKSPYSTTMNPNIHYFIHCIGSASGQTRSKNARYLSTVQVESVTQNSIIFAYAFKLTVKFDAHFSKFAGQGKDLKKDKPDVQLVLGTKKEPKTKIGKDWLRYVQSYNGLFPEHCTKRVYKEWRQLSDLRPNTIGKHLYDTAAPILDV